MNQWFCAQFSEPFIKALACEWRVEGLLQEKGRLEFISTYIQATLKSQPRIMSFVIQSLCVIFLLSARLMKWNSFAKMDSKQASQLIKSWRNSRWPGFSQLVQLFENLIALTLFSLGPDDTSKKV